MREDEKGEVVVEKDRNPLGWVMALIGIIILLFLLYLLFMWWTDGRDDTDVVPTTTPTSVIDESPTFSSPATTSPSPTPTTASPEP